MLLKSNPKNICIKFFHVIDYFHLFLPLGGIIMFCYVLKINWEALSTFASLLGSIATFITVIIAVYPYFKKGKVYFTIQSYIDRNPSFTIVNSHASGILIEKITFYAGPVFFKKCFFIDNFIEREDDLVSDKTNNFIEPYMQKKIVFSSDRIIHDIQHMGLNLNNYMHMNLRLIVHTSIGKIKLNTKIKTEIFFEYLLNSNQILPL